MRISDGVQTVLFRSLLGLHGSLLGGLGGLGGDGTVEPRVEVGKLPGAEFVQAGGLETFGGHRLLDRRLRGGGLCENRPGAAQQKGEHEQERRAAATCTASGGGYDRKSVA